MEVLKVVSMAKLEDLKDKLGTFYHKLIQKNFIIKIYQLQVF